MQHVGHLEHPDPAKVEALDHITAPTSNSELISFLCMMRSNVTFIANFAKHSATLRLVTKGKVRFQWKEKHQRCFEDLIAAFKKDALLRYFDLSLPTFVFTDAHNTGLGAMLAQGPSKKEAKPVAFASRRTTPAETRYPQLDLEAMGIDFGLRRFRIYLVGSPTTINVVTDHKPLCPILNKNAPGSIRTEKIKMRHQDIDYVVLYQKGIANQTDYISRKTKPLKLISKEEIEESNDLNNLLYMLHVTPIMDYIGIGEIAKATHNDETLSELGKIIQKGQRWIPKSASEKLAKFKQILPELTKMSNGVILKGERIILPEKLQETAINLAHRGSHPGISGLERRLRYHFFFHDLQKKVQEQMKDCEPCNIFSDKKTSDPIIPHKVPSKCWETVAVDLFGPMPSSKHVVVVQDLASRYPSAKLVSSTAADKVIPAIADIYNAYGNPQNQLSDNGPPFNSNAMDNFAKRRNINLQKIPPLHPASSPVETFMKPLGKTVKIAQHEKKPIKEAIQELLDNYRDTPHPATGISPASMMFRDGMKNKFPRVKVSEEQVKIARERDMQIKQERGDAINASKYRKESDFQNGDRVVLRNHYKKSKFDPYFDPDTCLVVNVSTDGRVVTVERLNDGKIFKRHPDDIKLQVPNYQEKSIETGSEEKAGEEWQHISQRYFLQDEDEVYSDYDIAPEEENGIHDNGRMIPRRSTRHREPIVRYPDVKK